MPNSDPIPGVTLIKNSTNGCYVCYIENFSNEFKDHIRGMLSSIWHGSVDAEERENFNYSNTLKGFLERYNKKDNNTKKGMIGEMLTHLLIPKYISFHPISIMKNKEESSIRKGFDVVYCDLNDSIWYCEVKSGGDVNSTEDIDVKNNQLLKNAKQDIQSHSLGNRSVLWDSVLIDVNLTIFNSKRKQKIKDLLDDHHPNAQDRNMDRNVILASVLYKNMDRKICPEKLQVFKEKVDSESIFVGVILFSIQKPTFNKIEHFLTEEANI